MIFSLPPVRADGDFREGLLCVRPTDKPKHAKLNIFTHAFSLSD